MMYTATIAADDLGVAIDCVVSTLRGGVDRDWTVRAGSLEWSCWRTAEHVGQVFTHYASQVAIGARTRYVRWAARAQQPDVPPDGVLDFLEAAGHILVLVVRASPDDARAFHPYGVSDPAGFAAGGSVEGLIHGHDIATGLGVALEPPTAVCERLLARLFPHHAAQFADVDPWLALLQATGRSDLMNGARLDGWNWRASPLSEEWRLTEPEPAAFVYNGSAPR
jgi:hypothetical protein